MSGSKPGPPGLYAVGAVLNGGRYRVHKRLNKGATAVVYAAEDLLTGRPVALKVVQCGSNKVPLNVVRREVSLSSTVAHENMVQLLDVFAEGTELIIVWELIAGGDLLELLNECNGCMTEPAAAFYYSQLLRGVLHMHAMGYCHRDIKPENCMIEAATQRLLLIDFGLSKHLESVATLGVGTPDYMPPEMVRSQMKQQQQQQRNHSSQQALPPYDAKAVDAWAMGVLLYLLVTGAYPFEDPKHPNNLTATLLNVQAGRCQPLPEHVSPGCRAVIMGLLCPDPQQRTCLEDLAFNPWLLQSAAAHAARLGPMGAHFDPGNPAWILPAASLLTAPAQPAPAPVVPARHSSTSTSSTTTTPVLLTHGNAGAPADVAFAVGGSAGGPTTLNQQQLLFAQQQHAWLLQQQQQASGGGGVGGFGAGMQQHQALAGPHWLSFSSEGSQPQQLLVPPAHTAAAQPQGYTGGGLFSQQQQQQQVVYGLPGGGGGAGGLLGGGKWPLQVAPDVGVGGYDGMDVGQEQHQQQHQQQHHHQQQQQQFGVVDSRAHARDQGDRAGPGESRDRKTGFNWLHNLVRKR